MERALKERIIGAIVLVAVVVLVVPVFLDGPPAGGEIRSERVPLPGQDEQKTQTVVLDRNRTEPVPTQSQAKPEPQPQVAAAAMEVTDKPAAPTPEIATEPDAAPPANVPVAAASDDEEPGQVRRDTDAAATTKPPTNTSKPDALRPARSSTGMFAVQLGSFSNKGNAEKLAADLRKQGFAAFLSQLATDSGQLQRVRVGPQKDRESAEAMAAKLAKAGHKGQVVPHP
jgi:DedD protein